MITLIRSCRSNVALATSLAVLWLAVSAHAESIRVVKVDGNQALGDDEVREVLALDPGMEWSPAADSAAASRLLHQYGILGFHDAELDMKVIASGPGEVDVMAEIREGIAVVIDSVAFAGNELFSAGEIARSMDTEKGDAVDPSLLQADMDRLLRSYAESGHPFARVLITSMSRDGSENGYRIGFRFVEGPRLTIGGLRARGNDTTTPETVRRLSGLRLHVPYDQLVVDDVRERLLRSGLFLAVEEPRTRVDWKNREAILEVDVEEARANRISGVAGYAPGDGGEGGVWSGIVDLTFGNILGTARRGEVHWEQTDRLSRAVLVGYREPWLFGSPLGLGGALEQSIRDSSYTRERGSITADAPLARRVQAKLTAGRETIRPRETTSPFPRSDRWWGSLGVEYDSRNHPLNPSSGILLQFEPEYAERDVESEQSRGIEEAHLREGTIELRIESHIPFGNHTVLSSEAATLSRFTDATYVPVYDQFFFGGARTLRGYEEDRFLGARIAWSRLELRRLLGRLSRAFVFWDAGYIHSPRLVAGEVERTDLWKNGFGLGVRLESRAGLIGIDYGLGEGDGFGDGKVHVTAVGEF